MYELKYDERFIELIERAGTIPTRVLGRRTFALREPFHAWASSALNLIEVVFGGDSTICERFRKVVDRDAIHSQDLEQARGLFSSAYEEYSLGYIQSIRREIAEEISMDLCRLAETTLDEGHLEPAVVIASAALEDAMKRKAEELKIVNTDNGLQQIINSLKAKGVFTGAESKIVSQFTKIRNAAMHAEWGKIKGTDVGAMLGFLKQFLIRHG